MSTVAKERVLVADDEENIRWILETSLGKAGFEVDCAAGGREAVRKARGAAYSLILLDISMPDMSGFEVMTQMRNGGVDSPVIFITAQNTPSNAIDSMQLGAYDYITKPFDLEEVNRFAKKAASGYRTSAKMRRSRTAGDEGNFSLEEIIGGSARMLEVYKLVGRTAGRDVTVLITGESGTGKELVARAIHSNSPRRKKRLVSVNISAIPRELMESELFGYEKGAFTGAAGPRRGRFEEADGGTLHIDEVGELSVDLQSKLLRAIEEKRVYRLGSERPVAVNARIIASTNRNLREAVEENSFREDLFYRLNVITVSLPPLRERKEDLEDLARHFLGKHSAELGMESKMISPEALEVLEAHDWPGNVRELENSVKRLLVLSPNGVISAEDAKNSIETRGGESRSAKRGPELEAKRLLQTMLDGADVSPGNVHREIMGKLERQLIGIVLERTGGNAKRAAQILGINRNTLSKKASGA